MIPAEWHRSLGFRMPLREGGLEIASDGLEQLATGREFTLLARYEVLETTGERVRRRIAAQLQYVCPSGRVLGVSIKGHRSCRFTALESMPQGYGQRDTALSAKRRRFVDVA